MPDETVWKVVTEAVNLAVRDTHVKVTIPDVDDFVITLPPAPEALQDKIYTIKVMSVAGEHRATVQSYESNNGGPVYTCGDLSAAGDVLLQICDGEEWCAAFMHKI